MIGHRESPSCALGFADVAPHRAVPEFECLATVARDETIEAECSRGSSRSRSRAFAL